MAHPQRPDPLRRLARMNPTGVFLAVLVIALAGLFLPGVWGAILLYAVVGALAWLLSHTWAASAPPARLVRLIILAGLAVIATAKIT